MDTMLSSGARISPNEKYRFSLWRIWDAGKPRVIWVMLNPSTADAQADDPTIKKCIKFARTWGYGGIIVVNLFMYRATNPDELKKLEQYVAVGPDADMWITSIIEANPGALVVAAWGQKGKLGGRDQQVRSLLAGAQLHALRTSKDGTPWHPLYQRDDTKPFLLGNGDQG